MFSDMCYNTNMIGITATHYKEQRDKLGYYLLEEVCISKAKMAKILGISRSAVSLQFPTRRIK